MTSLKLDSSPEAEVIRRAVKVLRDSGLLIYPTETVYGLGVDATNQIAVDKLLKFKGQRSRKPILIAVSDEAMAAQYVDLNSVARRLYRQFLPGPVAVVSKKQRAKSNKQKATLARGIASIDNTVGIRIPDYPLVREIISQLGKPITTTSANISGARNPWSIEDIRQTTPPARLAMIDLILDAGQLPKRSPSTIIDTSREETEIVREGEMKIGLKAKGQGLREERHISNSVQETAIIGQRLIKRLLSFPSSLSPHPLALVIALEGQLGVGKTVFVSGMARALGLTEPIRSPSYTLVREYRLPSSFSLHPSSFFFHLDAWRLHSPEEFADLGLEKMLRPGNIVAIEWAGRLAPIIKLIEKKSRLVIIKINALHGNQRKIHIFN